MKKFSTFIYMSLFLVVSASFLQAQEILSLPPVLPDSPIPKEQAVIEPTSPLALPEAQSQSFEIGTHTLGGLNLFFPVNKVPKEQAIQCLNLLSKGITSLEKRRGYAKVNFTAVQGIYGAGIAQGTNPEILINTADSLRHASTATNWEFTGIDYGNDTLTFFVSTPVGLIVLNGEDSARIWDGSAISALGMPDSGTFDSDSTDTSQAWTDDYWIGYWVKCGICNTLFEILDNGSDWLSIDDADADTCNDSSYQILSRPDSSSSGLTYPKGKAGTYYKDRFFISSDYYNGRIYYSAGRDPDDVPPENWIDLDIDQHDEIQAMRVFNGRNIVFSKYATYAIDSTLKATPLTKSVGCVAPYSIALGDDYIYFLSERGVYRSKANVYGSFSYNFQKISTFVDDIIEDIDPQHRENCGGIYTDQQYWLSYHPDSCLVFDEKNEQWYPQDFGFTAGLRYSDVFGLTWGENLYPDASVDTNDWTVSAGSDSHYYYIYHPDSLTDYLYSTTNGAKDFFTLGNTQRFPTGATVDHLKIYVIAQAQFSRSDVQLLIDLVANGQRYNLDSFNRLPQTWNTYEIEEITNPITSVAWVKGDLDSLKLAIRLSTAGSLWIRVGAVWVVPMYEGDLDINSFLFSGSTKPFMYNYGRTATDDTSLTSGEVYGKHVTGTYQTGWLDGDLPTDQKLLRRFYLQTESDSGDVWVYYYKDYGTTPSDSDLVHLGGKRTSWWMLGEKVTGKNFSVKVENKSNVDSLTIKGWSMFLNNLGARGGE